MSAETNMDKNKNRSQIKIKICRSPSHIIYSVFFIIISCVLFRKTCANDDYLNCEKDGKFLACHCEPQYLNFVNNNNFTIKVEPPEYTCGKKKSIYLRLGETATKSLECDASSTTNNHPVKAMVDTDKTKISTWWQSVTWPISLYDSTNAFEINITMSFNKMFRMTGDMKIVFHSGRPRRMILEKSMDYGLTWTTLQYYSRNCAEYDNKDIAKNITKSQPDNVICTNRFSGNIFNPRPGRAVEFASFTERYSLIFSNSNYKAYFNSIEQTKLLSFLSFTDLKIRLLYPATDAKETSRQPFDFIHYYYGISHIEVEGRCFCNLHGAECIFKDGQATCVCQHFTEGRECETCQPMYNNKPWKAATYSPYPSGTANECQKCECYDHAVSCVYNETVKQGVCVNCAHNTTGDRCNKCIPGFYPDVKLQLNDTARCIECSCESLGVLDVRSSCIQESDAIGEQPGQCKCKSLVTGRRCDKCVPQYYGLLENTGTCKMCNCETDGTVNGSNVCAQSGGQCPCKPSVGNRRCDICKEGYFQFPKGKPSVSCLACGCDSGLSRSKSCDKTSGTCTCKEHVIGSKCTTIDSNYFVPALDDFLLQPEGGQSADCMINEDLWKAENPFDGSEFAACPLEKDTTLKFQQILGDKTQMDVVWPHHVAIRYTLKSSIGIEEAEMMLTADGPSGINVSNIQTSKGVAINNDCGVTKGQVANVSISIPPGISVGTIIINTTMSLDKRCKYTLSLRFTGRQNSTDNIIVDSAILVPALVKSNVTDVMLSFRSYADSSTKEQTLKKYQTCLGEMVGLRSREATIHSGPCMSLLRSVGAELYGGTKICGCFPKGTIVGKVCDPTGGQCACKPGVGGRKCDACLSGFYNFTGDGCKPCNCVDGGSVNGACDKNDGQCQCKSNVAILNQNDTTGNSSSRHCGACQIHFYGYGSPEGCLPCQCNSNGSKDTQCAANGQCPCKDTIGGRKCDICEPKYYKFSAEGCVTCKCSSEGSLTGECHITSGSCECKDNVQGDNCSKCKPGFFNLDANNPKGCQPCFCYEHGTTCTFATGYSSTELRVTGSESLVPTNGQYKAPPSFLGDRHWSYGQKLSFIINNNGNDIDLNNAPIISLENEGVTITYYHRNMFKINRTAMPFTVPMYEWAWTYNGSAATAAQFYRVLSSVSNIYISEFINGSKISISELVLVTAKEVGGNGSVTFVEKCTCKVEDFITGTSCEKCAEGYRRPKYQNDTRYSKCEGCDCKGREATTPPLCDEWSGICSNCKNGTTGDHCESCSAFVQEPDCNKCQSKFYGLDMFGCKACECHPVGSTSSECNHDTGQCPCAPHVIGRKCDECEDNYYNLQKSGCSVCNECYSLTMTEVQELRSQRDNLTTEIERIKENDANAKLGSFKSRIAKIKSDRTALLTFLRGVTTAEVDTQTKLNTFKSHIATATLKVATTKSQSREAIEKGLLEGDVILRRALDNKDRVDITIKDIKALTGPISKTVSKLGKLAISLESAESYLMNLTSNASSGLSNILKTIKKLENTSSAANTEAKKVSEKVQLALTSHHNNTRRISDLKKQNELLKSTGETAIAEAREALTTSNITYTTAVTLTEQLVDIEAYNPNITIVESKIASIKTQAEALKNQVTGEQVNLNAKLQSLTNAVTQGGSLLAEANSLSKRVDSMYTKASNALKLANDANASATVVFQQATNMLETMENFDTRRQAVETTANQSLDAVKRVKDVSEEVITEAGNLRKSLITAQQNSVMAKEAARQSYTMAQQHLTEMTPVGQTAAVILNNANTQLNDLESKANTVKNTNDSIVGPAAVTCDGFAASVTNLQTRASTSNEKAKNLTIVGGKTKERANKLIAEINAIGEVDFTADTARLTRLKANVQTARTQLTALDLAKTLTNLKQDVNTQKIWLQNFRTQKANLETQIAYLKQLQVQVK